MQDKKLEIAIKATDEAKRQLGIKKWNDLDELIGVSKGSVALWRSRDGIPVKYHEFFVGKCNLDRGWLRSGDGNMSLPKVTDREISGFDSIRLSSEQKEILGLWEDINDEDRVTVKAVLEKFAGRNQIKGESN